MLGLGLGELVGDALTFPCISILITEEKYKYNFALHLHVSTVAGLRRVARVTPPKDMRGMIAKALVAL